VCSWHEQLPLECSQRKRRTETLPPISLNVEERGPPCPSNTIFLGSLQTGRRSVQPFCTDCPLDRLTDAGIIDRNRPHLTHSMRPKNSLRFRSDVVKLRRTKLELSSDFPHSCRINQSINIYLKQAAWPIRQTQETDTST